MRFLDSIRQAGQSRVKIDRILVFNLNIIGRFAVSDFRPDIWRLQASFDTQGLIEALSNSDAGVRRRAAAALRALGAVEAVPALKTALDKEQDTDTRSNIVATLAALELEKDRVETTGTDESAKADALLAGEFSALMRQLDHAQPEKVVSAALRLGELRDKRAVEPLVMLFNNARVDIKVRLAVAEALLKLESAPVEVALLGALRSPNWRIRRNGAAILGQLKAEWAIDPLAKALNDDNDTVRKTARAALRHINTTESRAALGISEKPSEKTTPNRKTGLLPRLPTTGTLRPPTATASQKVTQTAPLASPDSGSGPVTGTAQSSTANPTSAPSTVPSPQVAPSTPTPTPAAPPPASAAPTVPTPAPVTSTSDYDAPTQSQRPSKLMWPKKPEPAPEEDPSKIPTRPLDPRRLEEAEERLNNKQKPDDS